jgi:hypothetical protein
MSLDVHVLRLPSEAISLIVADDRLPTFLDDNASWFLNQETVTLAHLVAGAAHIIETPRIILSGRWDEGASQFCSLRAGRRWRRLNCGRRDCGLSDRLLRCNRTRRLDRRAPSTALTLLLLRNRQRLPTL